MIAAIAFGFSVNLLHAQSLTAVMYVRTTNEARNRASELALQNMVDRLNAGGRKSEEKFFLTVVDYFGQARYFEKNPNLIWNRPRDRDVDRIAVIAHGIYDQNKNYTQQLEDKDYTNSLGGTDDSIRWEFKMFYGCGTNTIDSTGIGKAIAAERYFEYPAPPPTAGKPTSGIWDTGTRGSGYWATVTHDGTIGFMGSDGKYYVVGYSVTVHVWVSTGESPSDVAMS
jgi:hypothetical protein